MHVFWILFLAGFGACIGSFLNVVIYRLPRGESIVFPSSHCPACGRAIRWYHNIPLVSWLVLCGRCRDCKSPISPRYPIIEAAAALRVAGLYACYYMLTIRAGAGDFVHSWPMFAAHAALLCGLLAVAVVDLELFIIPLEVMWVCSLAGLAAAAWQPHPFLAEVSPRTIAVAVGGAVGLAVALALMRLGYIQPSFIDAEDRSAPAPLPAAKAPPDGAPGPSADASATRDQGPRGDRLFRNILTAPFAFAFSILSAAILGYVPFVSPRSSARNVAISAQGGLDPRKEMLREVLFLVPAMLGALAAWQVLRHFPAADNAWAGLFDAARHPAMAPRLASAGSALFGYLIGGLWIWGIRIIGTLAFGKEAMGMGDVHILAAVGAVTGWIVPSIAFFIAPVVGLLWALCLWRRELPFGPSLAVASMAVMIFHDVIVRFLKPILATMQLVSHGRV